LGRGSNYNKFHNFLINFSNTGIYQIDNVNNSFISFKVLNTKQSYFYLATTVEGIFDDSCYLSDGGHVFMKDGIFSNPKIFDGNITHKAIMFN